MPTMPASISSWKRRAAPPSRVKIAVPLPYGEAFISATPSSYVSTRSTHRTGPKISSRYASESVETLSRRERPIQWPSSKPSTVWPVPSRTTSAPWAAAPVT